MKLQELKRLGFDKSYSEVGVFTVRCSQCEACFVNGVPCHEHGCPNARKRKT